MLNIKQAYNIAKPIVGNLHLISILSFTDDFGFLFVEDKNTMSFGNAYVMVNKNNKKVSFLHVTPMNVPKIQSGKRISLTTIL